MSARSGRRALLIALGLLFLAFLAWYGLQDPRVLLQAIISGLLIGGVYALSAMGLTLIFGVMRIINFAHGTFLMLGMYAAYWLFHGFSLGRFAFPGGVDPYVGLVAIVPAFFLLGVFIQRTLINRVLDAPEHSQLLLTLGVSLIFQNAALALFGATPSSINTAYGSWVWAFALGGIDLFVSMSRLLACLTALAVCGLLFLLLHRTDVGKAMRAAAEERDGAQLVGIDVRVVYGVAFGIGLACVAVTGAVVLPFFRVSPEVGDIFVLLAFVTVVLGGMGNLVGALLGGLLIGVAENLGALLPQPSLKHLVVFAIFVLVLLFRPTGLLGTRQ
jgi:branched-chain amino acid transport system permease protein